MTYTEKINKEKQAENKNNEKEVEINKKYDDMIKAQLSVNYWPYWIISSIGAAISLYMLGVSDKNSILIGGMTGIIIALFWQSYIKYTNKKSQAYLDIQKQRAYAIKALKNDLLSESQAERQAVFKSTITKTSFFQVPPPGESQKVNNIGKHPIKKTKSNKWMLFLFIGFALFVFVMIVSNVSNIKNFTKSFNLSSVTPNKTIAEHDKHSTINEKSKIIKKNTAVYKTDENLRHCLELPTKQEVILCSEQAE